MCSSDLIEGSMYYDAIVYCIEVELLTGMTETTMEPEKALTRAEMMVVLERLEEVMK